MFLKLLLIVIVGSVCEFVRASETPGALSPEVIRGDYSKDILITLNSSKEFIVVFPKSNFHNATVVSTWTKNRTQHPVFVMVTQTNQVTSWELPLTLSSYFGRVSFWNTSRTLCHDSLESGNENGSLIITISTASNDFVTITLRADQEDNHLKDDTIYSTLISPSVTRHFYYKPHNDQDVTIEINSEVDGCFIVSVQNSTCPVFDRNENVQYQTQYQTVSTIGALTVKKSTFPHGFILVFVAKPDNYDCTEKSPFPWLNSDADQLKSYTNSTLVKFQINPNDSYEMYMNAFWWTIVVVVGFYLLFTILVCGSYQCKNKRTQNNEGSDDENDLLVSGDEGEGSARENLMEKKKLMLSDFVRRKSKRSLNYFWHLVNIAIFYGIPVVQLVITCQRVLNSMGDQDVCYYNFLCSHPLFGFNDFNHIFSNVGYIAGGISFLLITLCKDKASKDFPNHGIPQEFDLFYAMGIALVMEGVLSACYHICPNQSNFQFDTSFMYIMITLCIIKLYQNRHPSINPTAYATFMVLGVAIVCAILGVFNDHITYWITFVVLYVLLCMYVSCHIYFLNRPREGMRKMNESRRSGGILKAVKPIRKERFTLLVVANIINIFMASSALFFYYNHVEFSRFLLYLLIGNAFLYTSLYIIMKVINGEQIYSQTVVYGIISVLLWGSAIYFYLNKASDWHATAAKSKEWNKKCTLLNFYDYHDIWHFISAPALFFSFMLLLSLDDDLVTKSRNQIPVF